MRSTIILLIQRSLEIEQLLLRIRSYHASMYLRNINFRAHESADFLCVRTQGYLNDLNKAFSQYWMSEVGLCFLRE